jgi:hypothetical protein
MPVAAVAVAGLAMGGAIELARPSPPWVRSPAASRCWPARCCAAVGGVGALAVLTPAAQAQRQQEAANIARRQLSKMGQPIDADQRRAEAMIRRNEPVDASAKSIPA